MATQAYRDKNTRNTLKIKYILNSTSEGKKVCDSIFSEIRKGRKQTTTNQSKLSQFDTIAAVEEKGGQ